MFRLKLSCFRRFREPQEFTFPPGLTIVSGPNGAGKSTVVEALVCALFGYGVKSVGNLSDVRTDGADDDPHVECSLMVDDHAVEIRRHGKQVELSVDDAPRLLGVAHRADEEKREFAVLLGGMSPEQFQHTYIALQGDTPGLALAKDSRARKERRAIIESVLQLDVVNRAVQQQDSAREGSMSTTLALLDQTRRQLNLGADASDLLTRFKRATSRAARLGHSSEFVEMVKTEVERRRTAHVEVATRYKQAVRAVRDCQRGHKRAKRNMESAKRKLDAQDELGKKYEKLGNHILAAQVKVDLLKSRAETPSRGSATGESLEEDAAFHDSSSQGTVDIGARLAHLPTVRAAWEALSQTRTLTSLVAEELAQLDNEGERFAQAMEELSRAGKAMERLVEDPTTGEMEQWRRRKASLEHKRTEAEQARVALVDGDGSAVAVCPTCGQPLDEDGRRSRLEELSALIEQSFPLAGGELDREGNRLSELRSKWQYDRMEAGRAYEDAIGALVKAGLQRDLQKAESALLASQQEQAALGYDAIAHERAKLEYKGAEDTERSAGDRIATALVTRATTRGEVDLADSALGTALQLQDALSKAFASWEHDASLFSLMSAFRSRYFASSTLELARRATELLQYAVTDQSISGLLFENDELYYLDSSHARYSVERLSGGEKALVGLALRVALAELAHNRMPAGKIRVLILDEILSALDDERRDSIQEILDGVLRRGVFEHIILITHLNAVKEGWRAAGLEVRKVDNSKYSELMSTTADWADLHEREERALGSPDVAG